MVGGQDREDCYSADVADVGEVEKIPRQDLRTRSSVPDPCSFEKFSFQKNHSCGFDDTPLILLPCLDDRRKLYLVRITIYKNMIALCDLQVQ